MEFNDNKPIYRQIVDHAFNCIIDTTWKPCERIPSVRELAGELGVNTRTVLRALDELQVLRVIEAQRGMGFILADDAVRKVIDFRKKEFFESTVPMLREEVKRLGITEEELVNYLFGGTIV